MLLLAVRQERGMSFLRLSQKVEHVFKTVLLKWQSPISRNIMDVLIQRHLHLSQEDLES